MSILSPDVLKALQKDYIESFPEKWRTIADALIKSSWSTLEREFHKMSGSGTTYKMPEISKIAKAIELYLERNSPPDKNVIDEATEVFRQVLEARQNDRAFELDNHPIFEKLK